jgi:type II secretory pathway component PulM
LLAVVSRGATDAGFGNMLKQAQMDTDGSVRVQMQGVGFDDLVRWLGSMRRQYGISVREMNTQRAAAAGTVDATLTLITGA